MDTDLTQQPEFDERQPVAKPADAELSDAQLDHVAGGLLPAVQKVREAAARISC